MRTNGLDRLHALWSERFGRPVPEKIVCVGLNYHDHAAEQGVDLPTEPLLFAKLANALCGPEDSIVLPPESAHVDAEAELAVVLPQPLSRDADTTITIEYAGPDALRDSGGGNFVLLPRSTWYPNNASSSFGDRAKFRTTYVVPKKFVVVGTGAGVPTEATIAAIQLANVLADRMTETSAPDANVAPRAMTALGLYDDDLAILAERSDAIRATLELLP